MIKTPSLFRPFKKKKLHLHNHTNTQLLNIQNCSTPHTKHQTVPNHQLFPPLKRSPLSSPTISPSANHPHYNRSHRSMGDTRPRAHQSHHRRTAGAIVGPPISVSSIICDPKAAGEASTATICPFAYAAAALFRVNGLLARAGVSVGPQIGKFLCSAAIIRRCLSILL